MKRKVRTLSERTLICAVIVPLFGAAVMGVATTAASAHATHNASRATTIRVSTHNSRYVLSAKSAPRGVVIFKVKNPASEPHDFSIKGHTTRLLMTGQSATLRVTFRKRGRYPYRDTFDHHAQFGCRGGFKIT